MPKPKKSVATPASLYPRLRVMCRKGVVLGPGRIQLMEFIGQTGSLRSAAARMGMAYMTAWNHVKVLNRQFRSPVVLSQRGGKAGGGAILTQTGRHVLELYHDMEEQSHSAIQQKFQKFQSLLRR